MLFLAVCGCEKEIPWEFSSIEDRIVVIECLITNEKALHPVNISLSMNSPLEKPEYITDAVVSISTDDTVYEYHADTTNPGIFVPDSAFRGVTDKMYELRVVYNNQLYSAESYMIPVTDFRNIQYAEYPYDDNTYYLTRTSVIYNPVEASMIEVYLDWSNVTGFENENPENCKVKAYFYNLRTIDVSQVFAPGKEEIIFPKGTSVIEKKYSLNPDQEEYIRTLLSESEWKGGFFDVEPSNIATNIDGGIGYFCATTVISHSYTIN